MSTIEERLSRDIEAVTGGIVVTDSELRDARVAVEDRIEGGRQRDRRRGLVVAAAAAAVVVGVATWQGLSGDDASPSPAPPGPSTAALSDQEQEFLTGDAVTTENLPGVWRLDNSRWLFMFTSDGGFRYDETGRLSAHPRAYGTYAVDGDTISVDIEGGSAGCAGKAITLRAVVTANGPLHVLPVGSDPSSCGAPFAAQWVLEPVLPAGYFDSAPEPSRRQLGPAGRLRRRAGHLVRPDGRLPRRAAGRRDLLDHHAGPRSWPTAAPGPSTRRSPGSPWSAGRTRRRVARGTGSSSTTCGRRTSAASTSRATSDATTATWRGQGTGWVHLAP